MFLYILSVLHCLQDASLKKMKKNKEQKPSTGYNELMD